MTAADPIRALPIRVPVADGESLDSWLEALARRNGMSIGQLLPAFGWRMPGNASGLLTGVPGEVLRRAERQAGLAPGRLDLAIPGRHPDPGPGPVRCDASPWCPQCLAERGGRWLLAWRLPWTFACIPHQALLHDTCPGCGQPPRSSLGQAGLSPAGSCLTPGSPGSRCAADLTVMPRHAATPAQIRAQQQIAGLLAGGGGAAARTLGDLTIIGRWLLRQAPGEQIARSGPHARDAWAAWRTQNESARRVPPASTGLAAAAAVLAMPLLAPSDEEVITRIRQWLPPRRDGSAVRPPGMTSGRWTCLSPASQNRFLRALDPQLTIPDRLRHRSGTTAACLPAVSPAQLAARARQVPQLLWPGWGVRLMPPSGFLCVQFRSAIAACLLLPGNPDRTARPASAPLHAYRTNTAVKTILHTLTVSGNDSVLAAISCLASYLDASPGPIDYQRRRDHIPAATITASQWQQLCDQASAHPGEERRLSDGGRYVYQLLTGADLSDPRCPLAFTTNGDRARYVLFTDTLTTPLRTALHGHAARLLDGLGIAEPLTWEPPASCCAGLALPGRDPADIGLAALAELMVTRQFPAGKGARQLGTTTGHVRLALEQVHRPAPEWGTGSLPVVRRWQEQARHVLTRDFYEREYGHARKTLTQIQAETGFSRKYIAERARHHGFPVTNAFQPLPIDPDWLHEQYITRQRSYTDIARQLDVTDTTVITAARRHGITSRAPGVRSRPEMITPLSDDVPADIRLAVEGSLHGWQRLHRFQTAMQYPTIKEAAAGLGAHQAALIHQFQRLEKDIGHPLYQRASGGKPMKPNARGTALIAALSTPQIVALAQQQRPDAASQSLRQPGPAVASRRATPPAPPGRAQKKRTTQ